MSDRKPKVLIVHNYYQIPGGEDTVVANEKKLLEKHGHEVVLYTKNNSELKTLSKIQKILLPVSTVFNFQTYKEVKKLIKKEKIDILHVHNTLNLVSPSVYYAAFSSKIPVVQTIHNFRFVCPGATFFRAGEICEECLTKGMYCAIKHKCYRESRIQTAACVISNQIHRLLGTYRKLNYICLTEFNKEKILSLKQIKPERVYVKSNFVESAKSIVPYKDRENKVVFVGRLEEIKGIRVLLEAWKSMGDSAPVLQMCGTGPLEEWAKDFIEKNQLERVEMLGFVANDTVRELIGNAKALVLPTQVYEGFPMTIAESFAAGTPVLGSDLGNTGSLITEGENGWKFHHKSAESLVLAVGRMQAFQGELQKETIHRYSAESNYQQLREIYETCCNHH